MDKDVREHFEKVIALARNYLSDPRVIQNDVTANRAILEIRGEFQGLDVRLKQIRATSGNLYSYYVLKSGSVIAGFDNYSDIKVIKAKYKNQYRRHLGELVPHYHGLGKNSFELTAELSAQEFFENLEHYVNS